MADLVLLVLLSLAMLLGIAAFFLLQKISVLEQKISSLLFDKSSSAVRFGKMSEQLMPFSGRTPFAPENFRFIGAPIDGIAFEDDRIVFCEFKSGGAVLSERQKKIKKLVEEKKVRWEEVRLS
ncbi:MAG: Holliday junction resolvase-like protein [archaeon]|nr:Holliday junction resolvase-like protein [archaeon]